ncbi:DUF5602 domain-containing protein [Aestuariirhabdus litorea]|uniref:TTHB210-like domain-containing protein n=1 Tax=Aestuariirhabdus litorea TaxID=2528527 RepID=A0A3P3VQK7_9GAMM|nr:DUF5602 domain-containing protein [Aestuariirhabdus litorea]RRJ85081.1 hypothetical protein D0544_08420 [Aestuariirhabdus litorea]RWW98306.1 hypothetical protein DZC74_08415 [Endozoicomonadaceae bacterium GTF-13]
MLPTPCNNWCALPHFLTAALLTSAGVASAQSGAGIYEGKPVPIGNGTARTVVKSNGQGEVISIGVVFTPEMLEGLPSAYQGESPNFPYPLSMPTTGPATMVDHVLINWESEGHPPQKVYDVPHFDFHFYLVSPSERMKVSFGSPEESAAPEQQPSTDLLPEGYLLPPGTAVPQMGAHAIDPTAAEFNQQPFTTTFIYGYYNRQQTFLEPMISLAFLQSRPDFTSAVPRPQAYSKPGPYPSSYSVKYHPATNLYEVSLGEIR